MYVLTLLAVAIIIATLGIFLYLGISHLIKVFNKRSAYRILKDPTNQEDDNDYVPYYVQYRKWGIWRYTTNSDDKRASYHDIDAAKKEIDWLVFEDPRIKEKITVEHKFDKNGEAIRHTRNM